MSDGSKEIGREFEQKTKKHEDFVRAIAKIAVSQIYENEGFQSFQQSTLDALADVAVRYVKEIGKTANLYANLAGRSECNVLDVIRGLEDLGSIQGFPGCSDVHHSLSSSGVVREMRQYVELTEEVPFAYSLPRFPVSRECNLPTSFARAGEEPPGEHIPAWLPVFPSRESDCNKARVGVEEEVRVQERGESSVMMMHQGFVANNGSEAIFGPGAGDSTKQKRTSEINPFLAPPLLYGEKEVSSVVPPSRFLRGATTVMANHVTGNIMEEGFAPAIEAPQNKVSEPEERDKSIGFNGRPVIRFKLSSARKSKSLPVPTNVIAQDNGDEELASCFETRDAEKDEKKRRLEQILKDSMENTLDPTEL